MSNFTQKQLDTSQLSAKNVSGPNDKLSGRLIPKYIRNAYTVLAKQATVRIWNRDSSVSIGTKLDFRLLPQC